MVFAYVLAFMTTDVAVLEINERTGFLNKRLKFFNRSVGRSYKKIRNNIIEKVRHKPKSIVVPKQNTEKIEQQEQPDIIDTVEINNQTQNQVEVEKKEQQGFVAPDKPYQKAGLYVNPTPPSGLTESEIPDFLDSYFGVKGFNIQALSYNMSSNVQLQKQIMDYQQSNVSEADKLFGSGSRENFNNIKKTSDILKKHGINTVGINLTNPLEAKGRLFERIKSQIRTLEKARDFISDMKSAGLVDNNDNRWESIFNIQDTVQESEETAIDSDIDVNN